MARTLNILWTKFAYYFNDITSQGGRLNIKMSSYQYRDPHV